MHQFIYTFLGVIVGGLITWYVSRKYYIDTSQELNKHITKLIKNDKLVAEFLQDTLGTEQAAIKFDNEGNAIVLQKFASAELNLGVDFIANPTVINHGKQE